MRFMQALKKELARQPDATKCRTASEIASETRICNSQDEFERVMAFIGPKENGLVKAWRREDGLVVQPNKDGLEWIDGQKEKWPPQARIAFVALIFSVVVFVLEKWLGK